MSLCPWLLFLFLWGPQPGGHVQRDQVSFRRQFCPENGVLLRSVMISLSHSVSFSACPPCCPLLPATPLSPMLSSPWGQLPFFVCIPSVLPPFFFFQSLTRLFLPSKMLLKWPDSEAESRMVTVARAWGRRKG